MVLYILHAISHCIQDLASTAYKTVPLFCTFVVVSCVFFFLSRQQQVISFKYMLRLLEAIAYTFMTP